MAFTDAIRFVLVEDGVPNTLDDIRTSVIGNSRLEFDAVVAHGASNQHVVMNWLIANMQSFYLRSDVVAHVYTNHASGSTPDNTFDLDAGTWVYWHAGGQTENPVTVNVTLGVYVTVPGADDAHLKISVLQNL